MEIGYLKEVKAILKSLILSSPDKITVDKLNRDYRDIEGENIPFRRLGFNSLELFLHSIPDTLMVAGSGHTACVYFVSNDNKSIHIHNMIMQQKKSKPSGRSKSRPRHRHSYGNEMQTSPMQGSGRNSNNFQTANLPRRSPGQQFSPFQITNRNVSTRTVAVREMLPNKTQTNANYGQQRNASSNTTRTVTYALPQPKGIDVKLSLNDNQQKSEPKKPVEINVKPNCPQVETKTKTAKNSSGLENSKKYREEMEELENLLSTTCHVTASEMPTLKRVTFPPEVNNITKIKSPCGVAASTEHLLDIQPRKPKVLAEHLQNDPVSRGRNPLKAGAHGEENAKEQRSIAVNTQDREVDKFKKMLDISDPKAVDMDEAVPEFAANNKVFRVDFPKNTVPYGRKIPAYKVPDNLTVGSCIGIFIAEIHNPFKFWFHIHKEDEHELDTLMFQLERLYTTFAPNELLIPIMCLNPGQICAACFNGMWHRAEIAAPPVGNRIKVCFLDYGTVAEVNISEIKYLASVFAQLPAQALRGSLSHLKPRGLHWSHEATMNFLSWVSEVLVYAKITEIDREKSVFYMILCNTHGEEVTQINRELVIKRYALYDEEWLGYKINLNNGRRKHHPREDYPTFSMLESGEYPNFTELVDLQQRGIDYEMIHDRIIFNKRAILNFDENVPEPIRRLPFFLQITNPFRKDIVLELTGLKVIV